MKIGAVYVLYNPNISLLQKSLACTALQIEHIYVVDNSDCFAYEKIDFGSNVIYLSCNGNKGIAYALNLACSKAIEDGCDWVLTLDQDSVIPPNMIKEYSLFLANNAFDHIGLLTSQVNLYDGDNHTPTNTITEVLLCYTSGSFMNLKAFLKIGGFTEELFIDYVDFDYCLNLRLNNYHIYRINSVILEHHLGNITEYKLGGKHLFYVTNHNYIRRYYMTRNSRCVRDKYKQYFPEVDFGFSAFLVAVFKITFFEKNRLKKYRSICKGYLDYKNGRMGKYK